MDLIKKQGVGTYLLLGALVLSIIGIILYAVALAGGMDLVIANGSQPFYEATRAEDSQMIAVLVPCTICAMVAIVAVVVLDQFKFEGLTAKIVEIVVGVLRVAVPVLLAVVVLNFLYGSFTGIGWTFFSNAELEIAEAAKGVGTNVIVGLVIFAIAMVASVVAGFLPVAKKED